MTKMSQAVSQAIPVSLKSLKLGGYPNRQQLASHDFKNTTIPVFWDTATIFDIISLWAHRVKLSFQCRLGETSSNHE